MSSKEHHSTCSCTHCIYKSIKTDEDGLHGGSRIDRLYYDDYLPLREKKLLAKLVRTRGIYDDIRNRILSSSSVEVNSPLPPNHDCECVSDKKDSDAVLKLVELVDRGEHPSLNSLVSLHGECCGCCRCIDKLPKLPDLPQPRNIHAHIPAVENVNEFFEDHHIRRMKSAKTLDSERIARRQTEKNRMENENLRVKKESLIKKRVGFHSEKTKKKKTGRMKYKSSLKNAQSVFTENIRASIHSIEDTFNLHKIRKDSIRMHKDKLEKRRKEAWACDPDWCIPYECVPEDCFEKIKIREANKLKAKSQSARKDVRKVSVAVTPEIKQKKGTQIYSRSKKQKVSCECKEPSKSMTNILDSRTSSAEGYKLKRCFCTKKLLKKHNEFMSTANKSDFEYLNQRDTQSVVRKVKNHHDRKSRGTAHKPELIKSTNTFPRVRKKQKLRSSSSYGNQVMDNEFLQDKQYADALHRKQTKEKKRKMVHTHQHAEQSHGKDVKSAETPVSDYVTPAKTSEPLKQAVRISSSFEFNIEFSKTKVPETAYSKNTKIAKQGKKKHLVHSPVSERNQTIKHMDESKQVKNIPTTKYTNVICKCFPNDKNKKTKTADEIHTSTTIAQTKEQHVTPRNKPKNDVVEPTESMDKRHKIPKTNSKVACKCPSEDMSEKISQTIRTQKKTLFSSTGSIKRCFCTLKFQKTPPSEGRKQDKNKPTNKYINVTCKCFPNNDSKKSNTTDKIRKSTAIAQTKKQHVKPVDVTPLESPPGLLPYECEPGFCTPGRCDPYICIERIKIRNEPKNDVRQSTDSMNKRDKFPKTYSKVICKCPSDEISEKESQTIHKKQKSLSAYTVSIKRCFCTLKFQNQPNLEEGKKIKNKLSTKYTNVICKCFPNNNNKKSNSTDEIPKSTAIAQTKEQHVKPITDTPSEPAHSLLSYECEPGFCTPGKCDPYVCIERIKTRNKPKIDTVLAANSMDKRNRIPKTNSKVICKCPSDEMSEKLSQTIHTQKKTLSSSTEYIKRCFCTLKFQKPPRTEGRKQAKNTLTTKYTNVICKCFPNESNKKSNTTDKIRKSTAIAQTKKQRVKPVNVAPSQPAPALLPYECEPGFCTPGKCDPYICIERIKIRNKPKTDIVQSTNSMDKRNRIPKTNSKVICKCPSDEISEKISQTISTKKKSLSSSTGSLKRCFCTLKLQKKLPAEEHKQAKNTLTTKYVNVICKCFSNDKNKKSNTTDKTLKSTAIAQTKKQHVKSVNVTPSEPAPVLLPYECEPGTCTPGKCDPYICIERIKIRNKSKNHIPHPTNLMEAREKPVKTSNKVICKCPTDEMRERSTRRHQKKSKMTSLKKPEQVSLNQICLCKPDATSVKSDNLMSRKNVKLNHTPYETSKESPSKLTVRISSSFDFNIEFSKREAPSEIVDTSMRAEKPPKEKVNAPTAPEKDSKTAHKQKKIVAPFKGSLKRCFCTLTFQNQQHMEGSHTVKNTLTTKYTNANKKPDTTDAISKSTAIAQTKKQRVKAVNVTHSEPPPGLLPYECEPGFCTPGKCDPYVCIERIKIRNKPKANVQPTNLKKIRYKTTKTNSKVICKCPSDGTTGKESQTVQTQKKTFSSSTGSIKRCFCTLKFQIQPRKKGSKKAKNSFSKVICECFSNKKSKNTNEIRKSTAIAQTKQQHLKPVYVAPLGPPPGLLPYECEPGFCIPGKCDPYVCIERIKTRHSPQTNAQPTNLKKRRYKTTKTNSKVICKCPSDGTTGKESQTIQTQKKTLSSYTGPLKRCFCTLKIQKQPQEKKQVSTLTSKYTNVKCKCFPNDSDKKTNTSSELSSMSTSKSSSSQTKKIPVMKNKHKNKEVSKIKQRNSPKEKITAPIAKTASRQIVRVGTKLGFDIEFSRNRVPNEKI